MSKAHANKISIAPVHRGIDFLGYVIFLHHKVVRTKTRKRIFKKLVRRAREYEERTLSREFFTQSLNSYLRVLSHANTYKLKNDLENRFWFPSEG